jgi:hypothetical protein
MHAVFTPVISKYLKAQNHEIELRLGKMTRGKFDTNVGLESYNRALMGLQQYQGWEAKKMTKDTIYYGAGGRRAVMNEETDDVNRVIKDRVEVSDFHMEPFDVRLGISTEVPYEAPEEEEFDETRRRIRYSFIRKNLSIDVSAIKGSPDDMDAEDDVTYQIELEIIDPSAIQNDAELYNILYKVFDVMKIT